MINHLYNICIYYLFVKYTLLNKVLFIVHSIKLYNIKMAEQQIT